MPKLIAVALLALLLLPAAAPADVQTDAQPVAVSFACQAAYSRADFHRIAHRAYDGQHLATGFERTSHGSWSAYNPSGALGPYQLLGKGAPFPADTRAKRLTHHRIAGALWDGGAGASHTLRSAWLREQRPWSSCAST